MTAGVPLTDADRADWLWALHREIREARLKHRAGAVLLLAEAPLPRPAAQRRSELRFAHLAGPRELIAERMAARKGHYMPATLLDSQLATLEPLQDDEAGIVLDIASRRQNWCRA
jgi:carbohydrate kinase (thermoresistant glucokinase family)